MEPPLVAPGRLNLPLENDNASSYFDGIRGNDVAKKNIIVKNKWKRNYFTNDYTHHLILISQKSFRHFLSFK